MLTRLTTSGGRLVTGLVLVCVALGAAARASVPGQDEERRRAFELFAEQKFFEALPVLEKLAARHPEDGGVVARYGFSLYARSIVEQDAAKRKALRARARALLVKAEELGYDEGVHKDLVGQIIASVNPDGSDAPAASSKFSANPEADAAMREGEEAFVRDDATAALAAYERALRHDPKLYEAPLFAGDVFLKQGDFEKAGEWYARAIRLDPDREQAYRYWGNALLRQARLDEARDKYVEAVVADPYNPYVWEQGLFRWAQAKAVRLGHPEVDPPVTFSPPAGGANAQITLAPSSSDKGDGAAAWAAYGFARAAWSLNDHERFRKEYPAEKQYRHSLREEAAALRAVVEAVRNQQKAGEIKQLAPALATLVRLEEDGLLEAYILFARVRRVNSVAADYAAYRKEHRDKLRRYLTEYVTSGKY